MSFSISVHFKVNFSKSLNVQFKEEDTWKTLMASESCEILEHAFLKIDNHVLFLEKAITRAPLIMRFQSLPNEAKKTQEFIVDSNSTKKKKRDTKNVWEYFKPLIGNSNAVSNEKSKRESTKDIENKIIEDNFENFLKTEKNSTPQDTVFPKRKHSSHSQPCEDDHFQEEEGKAWKKKKKKLEKEIADSEFQSDTPHLLVLDSNQSLEGIETFLSSDSKRKKRIITTKKPFQGNNHREKEEEEEGKEEEKLNWQTPHQNYRSPKSHSDTRSSSDKQRIENSKMQNIKVRKLPDLLNVRRDISENATSVKVGSQELKKPKEICPICLSNLCLSLSELLGEITEESGKLDSCVHTFCFSCIKDWAVVSNECPMCKRRYSQIDKFSTKGTKVDSMKVEFKTLVLEENIEDLIDHSIFS
jgi:hypothetical protein